MRRRDLFLLVSVMVRDVTGVASNTILFASSVVKWAIKNSFDGVEVDIPEDTAALGFDTLVKAVSMEMALATQLWILSANAYMTPSFVNQKDLRQLHRAVDVLVLNTQDLVRKDQNTSADFPLYGNASWNSILGMMWDTLSRLVPVGPFMSRKFELQEALPSVASVSGAIKCRGLAPKRQYHSSPRVRIFFEVCQTLNDTSWMKSWQEDEYSFMNSKAQRLIVLETKESIRCKIMLIEANGLLGVALKQLGSEAFRESQECGARDTLFDAVATEFR